MTVKAITPDYHGEMKDTADHYRGQQLLYIGWDRHLMFAAPLCIPVPPGRHCYRLVVDGRWCADSFNPGIEINPFGEHNSVVNVE